jgi:hypothetical protein
MYGCYDFVSPFENNTGRVRIYTSVFSSRGGGCCYHIPRHVAVGADVGAGVQVSHVTGQSARMWSPDEFVAVHRLTNTGQNSSSTTPAHRGEPSLFMSASE